MIALKNIYKSFGQKIVLENMTLNMTDIGITCLLGASGCGKSTVLRIAAGLLKPDSGEVKIPSGACGVVFQDARLLPWLTVFENLKLGLPSSARKSAKASVGHVLTDVALNASEVSNMYPRQLSGGMAQRIGIARALLRGSSFLMLDEPFAALDAITRADLQKMLKSLVFEHKISALFVTHDMEESFKIASRIIIMQDGHVTDSIDHKEFADHAGRHLARERIMEHLRIR